MGKVIVDLVTKYLVNKGLDFDCSINGKVIAKGDDLIVHVGTPSDNNNNSSSVSTKSNKGKSLQTSNHNKNKNTMCVNIHLHYALLDLWEDSQIIEKSIHKALEIPVKTDRAQTNLSIKERPSKMPLN